MTQSIQIGASLKDLSKKWFAFSRIEIVVEVLREKDVISQKEKVGILKLFEGKCVYLQVKYQTTYYE